MDGDDPPEGAQGEEEAHSQVCEGQADDVEVEPLIEKSDFRKRAIYLSLSFYRTCLRSSRVQKMTPMSWTLATTMRREMRRLSTTVGRGGNCRIASQDSSVTFSREFVRKVTFVEECG